LRVVLDTNVVVSALLLSDSVPRQAFDKALGHGEIIISTPVLLELAEVLARDKLNKYLTEQERMRFLVTFLKESELVGITEQINDCRDPNDNKFLELAISGNADVLVTGDDDLLALNPFRGIAIVTPRDFLNSFTQPPPPSPH
jgi:putative PIN family toxin of toxin-antitoxin system